MWRPLCSVELGRTLGGARINIVIRHGRICGQRSSARIVTLRLAAYGQACVQVSIRSDLGLTDLIRCTGSGRICLRQDQFRGRGKFVHTSLSYASLHSGKAEQHGRTRGHDAYPAKSSIHSCCPFWKSAPISDYDTEVVNDADTTVELVMHHIARTRPGDSSMNSPILSINRSINRGAAHNPLRVKAVVLTGSPRTDGPFGQVQGVGPQYWMSRLSRCLDRWAKGKPVKEWRSRDTHDPLPVLLAPPSRRRNAQVRLLGPAKPGRSSQVWRFRAVLMLGVRLFG